MAAAFAEVRSAAGPRRGARALGGHHRSRHGHRGGPRHVATHPRGQPDVRLPVLPRGDPRHDRARTGSHRAGRVGQRAVRRQRALRSRVRRVEGRPAHARPVPRPGARGGRHHGELGRAGPARHPDVDGPRRRPPCADPRDASRVATDRATRPTSRPRSSTCARPRPATSTAPRSTSTAGSGWARHGAAQCAAGCAKHRLSSEASRSRSEAQRRAATRRTSRNGKRCAVG